MTIPRGTAEQYQVIHLLQVVRNNRTVAKVSGYSLKEVKRIKAMWRKGLFMPLEMDLKKEMFGGS